MTVPIAALQSVVMARAPWWALPARSMEVAAAWGLGFSILLSTLLLRGQRGVSVLLSSGGTLWVVLSALAAIRTHNPGMGFFTIFVAVYIALLASWIKHEFGRSFFDPQMSWFEGGPVSIPGVHCEIVSGDRSIRAKLSRLDEEGAFIIRDGSGGLAIGGGSRRNSRSELVFRFRDREVHCTGVPMLLFKRSAQGVGFRFEGNTPDQQKRLGDFIEFLRGEGYV